HDGTADDRKRQSTEVPAARARRDGGHMGSRSVYAPLIGARHAERPGLCQSQPQLDCDKIRGKPMYRFMVTALAALSVCVLANCTSPAPPPPTTASLGPNEGTITFSGGAVAIGVGFQWGSGTLTYRGRQYPFQMDGLSVVDIGVSRVTGT